MKLIYVNILAFVATVVATTNTGLWIINEGGAEIAVYSNFMAMFAVLWAFSREAAHKERVSLWNSLDALRDILNIDKGILTVLKKEPQKDPDNVSA